MLIKTPSPSAARECDVTPEAIYLSRRHFMGVAGAALAMGALPARAEAERYAGVEPGAAPAWFTEDYYNFVDDKKVKRLPVNTLVRNKLSNGWLAIVRHGGGYEIIPREAAMKIQERDASRIVLLNTHVEEPDADDPYAAYQIPDDLMW